MSKKLGNEERKNPLKGDIERSFINYLHREVVFCFLFFVVETLVGGGIFKKYIYIFFLKHLRLWFDFIKSFQNPRKLTFDNFYSEIFWNLKYFFFKTTTHCTPPRCFPHKELLVLFLFWTKKHILCAYILYKIKL